jgi:hypothetical protein
MVKGSQNLAPYVPTKALRYLGGCRHSPGSFPCFLLSLQKQTNWKTLPKQDSDAKRPATSIHQVAAKWCSRKPVCTASRILIRSDRGNGVLTTDVDVEEAIVYGAI